VKRALNHLAAGVVTALLALPLGAEDTRICPAIDRPALSAVKHQAGLRVFRDPATGKLRPPTREEAAELMRTEAEAAPESKRTFVVVEHADGMKSVDLQGALMQSMVVTRNANGSLSFRCVPAQFAAGAAAPAPVPGARPALEEK
jgi:hypothetical protein